MWTQSVVGASLLSHRPPCNEYGNDTIMQCTLSLLISPPISVSHEWLCHQPFSLTGCWWCACCASDWQSTVDKLIKKTNLALVIGTHSWREQFVEAVTVSAGEECVCVFVCVWVGGRGRGRVWWIDDIQINEYLLSSNSIEDTHSTTTHKEWLSDYNYPAAI